MFVTATPINLVHKNESSSYINDAMRFSMDNENIYGKVFFQYSWKSAFDNGYIVPFTTIHWEQINEVDIQKIKEISKLANSTKNQVYFVYLARWLIQCIHKYNMHYIIVYVSNQEKARLMCEILFKFNMIDTSIYISDQKDSEKKDNFEKFQKIDDKPKVIVSVGIFNEGIDIPMVDAVMFAEERSSETMICQNIGRCLRKYNGHYQKTVAYVLIPNIVHNMDIENIGPTPFSSKFKAIRGVIDKLNHSENITVKRIAKRKTDFTNPYLDETIEEANLLNDEVQHIYDDVVESNKTKVTIDDEQFEDIMDKCDDFFEFIKTTRTVGDKLANLKTSDIKKLIQDKNINKTIWGLGAFFKEHKIPFIPHIHFKDNEWISYAHIFEQTFLTYSQAEQFIHDNTHIIKAKTPIEWISFYDLQMTRAFENRFDDITTKEFVTTLSRIPRPVKTFYQGDGWERWSKFLGTQESTIVETQITSKNASATNGTDKNLTNMTNNDYNLTFDTNVFTTFDMYEIDLSDIKHYIDQRYIVDSDLEVRFKLNKQHKVSTCQINVHLRFPHHYQLVPIVIDYGGAIRYDPDISNPNKLFSKQMCDRSETTFIDNRDVLNLVNSIFAQVRDCFRQPSSRGS